MDILGAVAAGIGEALVKPIGQQFGYLIHYHRNTEKLKDQILKLESLREGNQQSIDAATRKGEEIHAQVKQWIANVDRFMPEAKKYLRDDTTDSNKKCFSGWCPDLITRYQMGKGAVKKAIMVTELQREGSFSVISIPKPPEGIQFMSSGNFVDYETTKLVMMKVMESLMDETTKFIGIHGMGGVGKTTLVTEIGKRVKEKKLFDEVLTPVVVTQTLDLRAINPRTIPINLRTIPINPRAIQGQIADMLDLKLTDESENGRASRIYSRLKDVKKILIILDNVWSGHEFTELGIPFVEWHKGCKVIITTRRRQIFNSMGLPRETTKIFHLGVLSEQESWDLLRRNATGDIDSPTLNDAAKDISKECQGLPIAIVTVGRALRDKRPKEWKQAAEELKKSAPRNIGDVEDVVYKCIRLSYDFLGNNEAKRCFLLCSLFPEDHNILVEKLVRYGVGLRIFENFDTVQEATGITNSLVNNLIESCLLLKSDIKGCVKMHDVVRDVAIYIGTYLVRSWLVEWPDVESFEHYTGISLMNHRICELPAGLESGNLQILLLENNSFHGVDEFFEGMKALRVLDLKPNKTNLMRLKQNKIDIPPSFCKLSCLRTLILDNAVVGNVNGLGQIRTLKVLSLRKCRFDKSPNTAISQLTGLQVLDMSYCEQCHADLCVIGRNVLSNLSRLEELYLLNTKIQQEALAELKSLTLLAVLTLSISDPQHFPLDLGCPDYEFIISSSVEIDSLSPENPNALSLVDPAGSWQNYAEVLLKKTNHLTLGSFKDIKNILPSFLSIGGEGCLSVLTSLKVNSCDGFEYLIDEEERGVDSPPKAMDLSKLEELTLGDLSSFKGIWHFGQLPLTRKKVFEFRNRSGVLLQNLRKLEIYECPRLKNLFQPCLAQKLHQLERLDVAECGELEEIVAKENQWKEEEEDMAIAASAEDKTVVVFKSLRELSLQNFPKLEGFCTGSFSFQWPLLNQVTILNCPKMKTFTAATPSESATTSESKSAPNLKLIKLDRTLTNLDGADLNMVIQERLPKFFVEEMDNVDEE